MYPQIIFEVKPSLISSGQVGLFALKNFNKDEIIVSNDYWDESVLISWEEFEKKDEITKEKLADFCYKDEKGIYAPADLGKINLAYFFNHSCDPNSFSDEQGNYKAKKYIQKGEEFTIDVEALMKKTIKSFNCNCGTKKCRKIVRI